MVLLNPTPIAVFVPFWRNSSAVFTEVKAIDSFFFLYRAFTSFEVISHTFLHFDLYHNPEKGRASILLSNLQMGNLHFGVAPWEWWSKVRTWGFSPPLCCLWKSLDKAVTISRTHCGWLGRAKLQREQKRLLCGLGLHSVILYVEANCPFNYCVGCTEIDAHSLSHWQQPEWPRCSA